ncbi:hypothetical protein OS493_027080 [Desmophyllum pertusum]|uniref:Uncharacterized protein n=1 Tax=Desmophyllum pertusum TaxID=174260 RepID=A0A9W9Y9Z5_9CNID|nr:hypothetical protein OS493_027080 [Desmophyllum pertusum]
MQDCNVSIEEVASSSKRTVLVTGQHGGQCKTKIPVHDYSDSSVQIPSQGIQTTQFVLARHYPPRNETCISVHLLSSQDFSEGEMCALIGTMEQQPVPFCIEHMGRQESNRYFHSAFIKDQVTIRFQLVNQVQRNFRLKDPQMAEKVITVPQIKSLSQRWVEPPGAIAEMCLESLDKTVTPLFKTDVREFSSESGFTIVRKEEVPRSHLVVLRTIDMR